MKIFIRSYKSRRDGSEGNKPNFHLEDFRIPTLSNDSSYLGEGLISKEECKKVKRIINSRQSKNY